LNEYLEAKAGRSPTQKIYPLDQGIDQYGAVIRAVHCERGYLVAMRSREPVLSEVEGDPLLPPSPAGLASPQVQVK
jgi:hypothetical protein